MSTGLFEISLIQLFLFWSRCKLPRIRTPMREEKKKIITHDHVKACEQHVCNRAETKCHHLWPELWTVIVSCERKNDSIRDFLPEHVAFISVDSERIVKRKWSTAETCLNIFIPIDRPLPMISKTKYSTRTKNCINQKFTQPLMIAEQTFLRLSIIQSFWKTNQESRWIISLCTDQLHFLMLNLLESPCNRLWHWSCIQQSTIYEELTHHNRSQIPADFTQKYFT